MNSSYTIRSAQHDDIDGIALVHVRSWQTTYEGIVNQDFLNSLDIQQRADSWRRFLSKTPHYCQVACAPSIVGFAKCGSARDELGYTAELAALYLLKEYQGLGIGRALLRASARELLEADMDSMYVWVLRDNPARQFYEAMGSEFIADKEIEIGGSLLVELAYGWKDLRALV